MTLLTTICSHNVILLLSANIAQPDNFSVIDAFQRLCSWDIIFVNLMIFKVIFIFWVNVFVH